MQTIAWILGSVGVVLAVLYIVNTPAPIKNPQDAVLYSKTADGFRIGGICPDGKPSVEIVMHTDGEPDDHWMVSCAPNRFKGRKMLGDIEL